MKRFFFIVGIPLVVLLLFAFAEPAHPQFNTFGAFDTLVRMRALIIDSLTAYGASPTGALLKPALDDSLLSYGIRPQLNAKTWFNLKPTVGARDTVFSIIRSAGNTEAFADTNGNFTLRGITMGGNLTGTATNTASVARFLARLAGSVSTPHYSHYLDEDTGSYSLGNYGNRWGIATGSVNRAILDSVGTFLRGKLEARGNVVPNSDSLQVWRSSLGNTVAFVDSNGSATVKTIKTDAFLWEVPAFSFNTYSADSATVTDLMDSTGTDVRQWFYKHALGNGTNRFKNTILMSVQIPSSVTPDSLIFKFRSNAASSDSVTVQCIVKNAAGTILKNTGQSTPAAVNTWEYKNFGAISAMTANQPCAYQFIVRTKYDTTVDVSAMYFK